MLFVAIAFFMVMNLLPKWILKRKYRDLEDDYNLAVPLMKLSGLTAVLLFAFLLTIWLILSSKDTYVENKNAVYGLMFDSSMESLGFQDSMRVIDINGKEIGRVSDIIKMIILESGAVNVTVEQNGIQQLLVINDTDKQALMKDAGPGSIVPIMHASDGEDDIRLTIVNHRFSDVTTSFRAQWRQGMWLMNPFYADNADIGGFITISRIGNIRGYLLLFSLNLIIVGIINLIPLPGLSTGNFLISIVETFRKKQFNRRIKKVAGLISILFVAVVIVATWLA